MEATISIVTKPFTFNFRHILFIVAITVIAFVLSNYFTAQHLSETELKFEDVSNIAEEIYSSGTIEAVAKLQLEASMAKKLAEELEGILQKTIDFTGCEVYVLRAKKSKDYPILIYGNILLGMVHLEPGEVWKVGMTKNGQEGRYPNEVFMDNPELNIWLNASDLQ